MGRLIDADRLKNVFDPDTWQGETLRTVIDNSPTAYDVDKVIEWTPVSEKLPEKDGYYLVSCKGGSVHIDFFWDGNRDSTIKNTWENKHCYEILAWRKKPEQYMDI